MATTVTPSEARALTTVMTWRGWGEGVGVYGWGMATGADGDGCVGEVDANGGGSGEGGLSDGGC